MNNADFLFIVMLLFIIIGNTSKSLTASRIAYITAALWGILGILAFMGVN